MLKEPESDRVKIRAYITAATQADALFEPNATSPLITYKSIDVFESDIFFARCLNRMKNISSIFNWNNTRLNELLAIVHSVDLLKQIIITARQGEAPLDVDIGRVILETNADDFENDSLMKITEATDELD